MKLVAFSSSLKVKVFCDKSSCLICSAFCIYMIKFSCMILPSQCNIEREREREMESKVMMVCVIVGILGAIAAALGFAAEAKRVKASQVEIDYDSGCVFPRSTAVGLGVGAAVALLLSQIIISFQTGCFTSKYAKLPINWSSARIFSFISRVAFGVGLVLLLAGVAVSSREYGTTYSYVYVECYVVKPGVFAAAAIFSLVSVAFGVLFYLNIAAGMTALPAAANTVAPPPAHDPQAAAAAAGFNYDVEQPQIPTHKPY